jgi:hypothetical protein
MSTAQTRLKEKGGLPRAVMFEHPARLSVSRCSPKGVSSRNASSVMLAQPVEEAAREQTWTCWQPVSIGSTLEVEIFELLAGPLDSLETCVANG